jgi:hypothetical protein
MDRIDTKKRENIQSLAQRHDTMITDQGITNLDQGDISED